MYCEKCKTVGKEKDFKLFFENETKNGEDLDDLDGEGQDLIFDN